MSLIKIAIALTLITGFCVYAAGKFIDTTIEQRNATINMIQANIETKEAR